MGSLNERHPSLWVRTTTPTHYPVFRGDATADVAIIGGGITGLTAALLLKAQGARVVLLEAGHIAAGTTGYTTGKVSALQGLIYHDLRQRIGAEAAALYAQANAAALEQVAALVARYAIDCGFTRRSAFIFTEQSERVAALEAETRALQEAGLPARFTTGTGLPFPVRGAVALDDQASLHARRYCLALAAQVADGGGAIFEMSRVTEVREAADRCIAVTAHGKLVADRAIVATLLPFAAQGEFHRKTLPSRTYLLAARLSGAPPEGMYINAETPSRTLRGSQGHLIVGGNAHPTGEEPDTRRCYTDLERWAGERFPIAGFDARWSAQDYLPVDGLPFIGSPQGGLTGRLLVATGLNKWGLSLGTAAAMILCEAALGRRHDWLDLFDAGREPHAPVSREKYRPAPTPKPPATPTELPPGSGAVFKGNGDAKAVCRDDVGAFHAVSAVCTHLGCDLSFNTAEQSWDCPCHGSRFTADGEVIDGPAVHDLPQA